MLVDNLTVAVITDPNDPDIHKIHLLGSKLFPEDGIFESEIRFRECLENNTNTSLQNAYGIGHEIWIAIKKQNDIIAAHNMLLIPTPSGSIDDCDGFAWWIYTFVDPAYRNKGLASHLKIVIDDYTRDYLSRENQRPCNRFIKLCEQNDPLQMTPTEFLQDINASGTNAFDRLLMAQVHAGFRRYGGQYMQPPLKGNQIACDHLMLQIAPSHSEINVTAAHLEKAITTFFAISVLGADPLTNPAAKQVLENIQNPVLLYDDRQSLTENKQKTQNLLATLEHQGAVESNTNSIGALLEKCDSGLFTLEQGTSLRA